MWNVLIDFQNIKILDNFCGLGKVLMDLGLGNRSFFYIILSLFLDLKK